MLDKSLSHSTPSSTSDTHDLYVVPYSEEYSSFLLRAADLLDKAGDLTNSSRYSFGLFLKNLIKMAENSILGFNK